MFCGRGDGILQECAWSVCISAKRTGRKQFRDEMKALGWTLDADMSDGD
jgi:hypothetical protein